MSGLAVGATWTGAGGGRGEGGRGRGGEFELLVGGWWAVIGDVSELVMHRSWVCCGCAPNPMGGETLARGMRGVEWY